MSLVAVAVAVWLRPWRPLARRGPPWPWLGLWAVMPMFWGLDRWIQVPALQPFSGAILLVLLAGWPLAVLAMVPIACLALLTTHMDLAEGLQRLTWLGIVPATLALLWGGAVRRWLPHHLFVYILGRCFLGTLLCSTVAQSLASLVRAAPAGTTQDDLLVAQLLTAFGEAFLTGMTAAILVAFHPRWLSTYTDRLYLPGARHG